MNKNDIDKSFVSVYDKFLFEFDATHKKSDSQLKEIKKHQRIFKARDGEPNPEKKVIWEDF